MADLTELELQEMIKKAREGDAEANFRMSEWALEQAMAEPEEERWNRLAAKCLVKAAEAGYAPAKERMDTLIRQLEEEKSAPAAPAAAEEAPAPKQPSGPESQPEEEPEQKSFSDTLQVVAEGARAFFGKAAAFVTDLVKKPEDDETDGGDDAGAKPREARPAGEAGSHAAAKHAGGFLSYFNFSEWDDAQWKKAQRIVLIALIVLALLIVILLLAGRGDKKEEPAEEPQIPVAATTAPLPTATPVVEIYPDETRRSAIEEASLDVKPGDADYVTEETTATVKTNGGVLHMRKGNATTYDRIDSIPNGTTVDVFAKKDGWALVSYNGTYGWCSTEYLK